jgi:putative sigma-54 modulation protein
MINKIEITGVHTEATDDIREYVEKKLGKLDLYIPKHARESAHMEVWLKEERAKDKKESTAEIVLFLPGETLSAKESTVNIYAAIDIVEQKIKTQIRKYKSLSIQAKASKRNKVRAFLGRIAKKQNSK